MPKIPTFNVRNASTLFKHSKTYAKPTYSLRESEKEWFRKVKKNYNRAIDRQVKAWQKVDARATYESLVRQGLVSPKLQKGLGDYKSRAQLFRSIKAMEEVLSPEYRAQQVGRMRERMKEVIEKAYQPEQDVQDLIDSIIDNMSPQDLVQHGLDNPDVVSDYYDRYKENVDQGVVDAEQYDAQLKDLLISLEAYATNEQLEELQAQEYLIEMRLSAKMRT